MSYGVGVVAALALLGGGILGKNKIEDAIATSSDSFTQWDELFKKYGADSWPQLKAIAMNESSLGRAASVARGLATPYDIEGSKSSDGKSWGLMQMTLSTARDYDNQATERRLNDPDYSVRLAAALLRDLRRQFASEEFVIKAYNQGAGNSRREMRGEIKGFAGEYWERYQRNRRLIKEKQGV